MEVAKRSKKRRYLTKGQLVLLGMTLPSILLITVFCYLPMSGWIYSFFDYRIGYKLSNSEFVGLANFRYAFGDTYVLKVIGNTLIISFLGMLNLPIACAIAILLSEVRFSKFRRAVQTVITLPNFISWVIVYSIAFALFSTDGLITSLIASITGQAPTATLLSNPATAKLFMVGLNIWKSAGYSSIIFFASITGIDPELYDAAKVDGAGRWHQIKFITVPSLLPTLMVLAIIQVGFILNNGFEQFYCFVNPVIRDQIEVLDYYVYRLGMLQNDVPLSTAVSMCKTFVSVVLVFSVNKLAKKINGQSVI
ncbi:MAG TPA: sugar ABC transporter permease [Clostridiales bacterium]|nr:sugar ABC transporter permease [Clostridiales bacterium]